jgi:hypothetical protein
MKFALGTVALLLAVSLTFSAWAVTDLRKQIHDLENKVSTLSERPAAPAPANPSAGDSASTSHSSAPSSSGGTDTVAGSATDSGAGSTDAVASKPQPGTPAVGASVKPEGWTESDRTAFEKEVLSVLDKREKEREARQEARQAEWMTARLKEQLKLTDQQAAEIGKIVNTTMADIDKIRATMTPENREEIRPQIQATLAAADAQVKALLTGEQVTAYDEMKKNGGGLNLGGRFGGGGEGGRRRGGQGGGGGEMQPQ